MKSCVEKLGNKFKKKIAKKRTNTHSIFNKGKYILKQRLLKREKKTANRNQKNKTSISRVKMW